ncbi:BPHL, partial [Symbiodinium necroappetens]
VLRWMGYPASFDVQQMLVKEVDIDESNTLDAVEMRKLVRKFQEKELTSWTIAFNQSLKKGSSTLEVPACARTLRSLGIKASESEVEEIRAGIAASFPSNKNRRFSSIMASTPAEAPSQKLGPPVSLLLSRPSKDRISVTSAVNSSSSSFAAISTSSSSEENAESSDDDLEDFTGKGIDLAVFHLICAKLVADAHDPEYVLTAGDLKGSPGLPVICLPGAMGTAETDFAGQLDGLSQRHAVVAFDPRGYGKSRPPNRRYPADFYHLDASDAGAIMDSLGIGSYNVIGWSDGAISATILASQRPENVKKLAVFGIQGSITKEDVDAYEGLRDVEKAWSKRMLETHRPVYGDDLQPMWSSFCDAMKMMYDAGGDICQKEAKQVKCPTFILHGAKDPLVPSHHPEWFHQAIAGSKLHVFPEGKHNIHQKFADEFNKMLLEFFAE